MCDMTYLHLWHDSFIRVMRFIHTCDMTHPYVWLDSMTCVTSLIHVIHSWLWHDTPTCLTWLIHMFHETHSYMWHDSSIRVTQSFHANGANTPTRLEWFHTRTTHVTHARDILLMCRTHAPRTQLCQHVYISGSYTHAHMNESRHRCTSHVAYVTRTLLLVSSNLPSNLPITVTHRDAYKWLSSPMHESCNIHVTCTLTHIHIRTFEWVMVHLLHTRTPCMSHITYLSLSHTPCRL